jgi:hypothetical protein
VQDTRKMLNSIYKQHLAKEDSFERKLGVDQYLWDGCEDSKVDGEFIKMQSLDPNSTRCVGHSCVYHFI